MLDAFSSGLIIPAATLALFGWLVPKLLSFIWPEGVRALLLLALVSTVIMTFLGMGYFTLLYVWQGVPLGMLFEEGMAIGIFHFLRLGLLSALLWAPIMVLSIAGIPKTWVRETW
jgi:hypothetical protein